MIQNYSEQTQPQPGKQKPRFFCYRELRGEDINCDLHVHTNRTDGAATIDSIIAHAVQLGLSRIALTEHVRRETEWFDEFAREVRIKRQNYPEVEVLVGCEAKALDRQGTLDASEAILSQCDVVLGSVHRFPDSKGGFIEFSKLSQEEFAMTEFELAMGLLKSAAIDVLAHPGGMYARRFGEFPRSLMVEILETSVKKGVAVEISTSYLRDLGSFLALCNQVNPLVSIGSDVHKLEQLGICRARLLEHGVGQT